MASRRTEKSKTFLAAAISSAGTEATEAALAVPPGVPPYARRALYWAGRIETPSAGMGYVGNGMAHHATT